MSLVCNTACDRLPAFRPRGLPGRNGPDDHTILYYLVLSHGIVLSSQRNRPAGLSPPIPAGSHTPDFPPVALLSLLSFFLSSCVCPLHSASSSLSLYLLCSHFRPLSFGIPLSYLSHYIHTLSYLWLRAGLALSRRPLQTFSHSKK